MLQKEVCLRKVQYDAEEVFRIGGFYCSEAIISSIRKNIDPSMPHSLVAAGSGFPIGVGRSRCMCGAISGAIVALGYFFGRTAPGGDAKKCMELANELQESFRDNHKGVLCCHLYIKGMDITKAEHKVQCVGFTGEMVFKTAAIIARELKLKVTYTHTYS